MPHIKDTLKRFKEFKKQCGNKDCLYEEIYEFFNDLTSGEMLDLIEWVEKNYIGEKTNLVEEKDILKAIEKLKTAERVSLCCDAPIDERGFCQDCKEHA